MQGKRFLLNYRVVLAECADTGICFFSAYCSFIFHGSNIRISLILMLAEVIQPRLLSYYLIELLFFKCAHFLANSIDSCNESGLEIQAAFLSFTVISDTEFHIPELNDVQGVAACHLTPAAASVLISSFTISISSCVKFFSILERLSTYLYHLSFSWSIRISVPFRYRWNL